MMSRISRKKPVRSHDMQSKRILTRLKNLDIPSLCQLDCFLASNNNLAKKLITALESYRDCEAEIFNAAPCRANLLTYLYILSSEITKASELNYNVLSKDSKNITALDLSVRIRIHQKSYQKAEEIITTIESFLGEFNREVLTLLAKAEHAFCLSCFGPAFYHQAKYLYEEVITYKENQKDAELEDCLQKMFRQTVVIYEYELALTCSKLMNQDNCLYFSNKQDNESFNDLFNLIKKLFCQVISESEQEKNCKYLKILAARSWTDLAIAFQKYVQKVKTSEPLYSLPDLMDVQACITKGLELATDDGHVLENVGRFYEQRACSEADFCKAIGYLEKCVEFSPHRHVAFHHLGLANRAAWIHSSGFEEAKIHNNSCRLIQHKTSKKRRKQNTYSGLAQSFQRISGSVQVAEPVVSLRRSSSMPVNSAANRQAASFERCMSEPIDSKTPSIVQNYVRSCSKQRKQKPFFRQLKANNPKHVRGKGNDDFLNKAAEYLKTANDLLHSQSVRYLVDLARIYVCLNETDAAFQCFERADTIVNCNLTDKCYLYEQWAFLKQECNPDQMTDIKGLLLEAVRFAVDAGVRSVAFHHLLELVQKQLAAAAGSNEALQKEVGVLLCLVQWYDKAEPYLKSVCEENPSDVESLWNLVKVHSCTNSSLSAFRYLSIICSLSKQNPISKDSFIPGWEETAFAVCFDVALDRDKQSLQLLFDFFLFEKCAIEDYHVLILGADSDQLVTSFIYKVLKDLCHLKVFLACIDGLDDVPFHREVHTVARDIAEKNARCVVFFQEDVIQNEYLKQIVKDVVEMVRGAHVCSITFPKLSESSRTEMPVPLQQKPKISVNIAPAEVNTEYERMKSSGSFSPWLKDFFWQLFEMLPDEDSLRVLE